MATVAQWDSGDPTVSLGWNGYYGTDPPSVSADELIYSGPDLGSATWSGTATNTLAVRFYFRSPETWFGADTSLLILDGLDFVYADSDGAVRLNRAFDSDVSSSAGLLEVDTDYRFELILDANAQTGRLQVFLEDGTSAIYDTGSLAWTLFGSSNWQFGQNAGTMDQPYSLLHIQVDNAAAFIGNSGLYSPPVDPLFVDGMQMEVWDGVTLSTPHHVGVWDGVDVVDIYELGTV